VVFAVLAVVAYVVVAQVSSSCSGSYAPSGYSVAINPMDTVEICFPHNTPFRLAVGYLEAGGHSATGFVVGSENNCYVSWVGQNGDGTPTVGCDAVGRGTIVLNVGAVAVGLKSSEECSEMVNLTSSYPGHTLMIGNSGTGQVRVTLMY
jgi:hypothetical protein